MEIKEFIEVLLSHNHFLQNYNSEFLTVLSLINPEYEMDRGGQPVKERGKRRVLVWLIDREAVCMENL